MERYKDYQTGFVSYLMELRREIANKKERLVKCKEVINF